MNTNAIGRHVSSYEIRAERLDVAGRRVSADMVLTVADPPERYGVTVETKEFYLANRLKEALDVDAAIEDILAETSPDILEDEPYVLNDAELTDEVLVVKFLGRLVQADLAACMHSLASD